MIDTGYGIYYERMTEMLNSYGLCTTGNLSRIIVTHADADHCGAAGFFDVPAYMHPGTREIIEKANRAYGSGREDSVLEEVYTTLIGLFSRFTPPESHRIVSAPGRKKNRDFSGPRYPTGMRTDLNNTGRARRAPVRADLPAVRAGETSLHGRYDDQLRLFIERTR